MMTNFVVPFESKAKFNIFLLALRKSSFLTCELNKRVDVEEKFLKDE